MRTIKTWTVRPLCHNPATGDAYKLWEIEESETVLQDYRNQGWDLEWTSPEVANHQAYNVLHLSRNWYGITEVES